MDKATTYELLSLASLLLFALYVWPPAALAVAGVALGAMAWVESKRGDA